MERFTAIVVLALGALVLIATIVSVAIDPWETTVGNVLVLLLVGVAMCRAVGHLRDPARAR